MDANKSLNSTKREIHSTLMLLKGWGLTDDLTPSEMKQIENQIKQVAKTAVNDYRNTMNTVAESFNNELS